MSAAPEIRVRTCNARDVSPAGDFVLYWMIAARRVRHSFGLEHAVARARELGLPLVVLEPLRAGYPWASDRMHAFVLAGMADNEARLAGSPVLYHPYVEPEAGAGKGLLEALAARAAQVVTDDYPAFFLPRMVKAAAAKCPVLMEQVDGNGLLPIAAAGGRDFTSARSFRFFWQKVLKEHLAHVPAADPLKGVELPRLAALPKAITQRWPRASTKLLAGDAGELARLPIDHSVPVSPIRGGATAGEAAMTAFLRRKLARYGEDRNDPDAEIESGLSPYLHFGHVGAHEVFAEIIRRDHWSTAKISGKANGLREGWWGASPPAEAFLEQLMSWRELGFMTCAARPADHDKFESLPDWVQKTLEKHAGDPRPHLYSYAELEEARTGDEIWNAAQRQLVAEGRIQNYLRMLWGKKVLEWSRSPREALQRLIQLNNKWALDGRDPNSYSGIFWVLGRYDRPWAPERSIFGNVRYMSSDSARKKLRLTGYLERWGGGSSRQLTLG